MNARMHSSTHVRINAHNMPLFDLRAAGDAGKTKHIFCLHPLIINLIATLPGRNNNNGNNNRNSVLIRELKNTQNTYHNQDETPTVSNPQI